MGFRPENAADRTGILVIIFKRSDVCGRYTSHYLGKGSTLLLYHDESNIFVHYAGSSCICNNRLYRQIWR